MKTNLTKSGNLFIHSIRIALPLILAVSWPCLSYATPSSDTVPEGMSVLKLRKNPNFDSQALEIIEIDDRPIHKFIVDRSSLQAVAPLVWGTVSLNIPSGHHTIRFANRNRRKVVIYGSTEDQTASFTALPGKTYAFCSRLEEIDRGKMHMRWNWATAPEIRDAYEFEKLWHWKLIEADTGRVVIPEGSSSEQLSLPGTAEAVVDPVVESDDPLIQSIDPQNSHDVIYKGLARIAAKAEADTSYVKAIPAIKVLLSDKRSTVRIKAALVLKDMHADMSEADLKKIAVMLSAPSNPEVVAALKSLRGFKAESSVPQILPLLQSEDSGVIRDACRTLAVLGNKDIIPYLEPVLNHPVKSVREDAKNAIAKLKAKP